MQEALIPDDLLPPGDARPRRHLGPVEPQHLSGPVTRALGRAHARRTQATQMLAHQSLRAAEAVLETQDLGDSRRLDLRPLLDEPAQDGLERVELRAERRTAIVRRLVATRKPYHGAAIDPQPPRDLPLRKPLRHQRPHLRPLQHAPHLLPPRSTP